MSLPEQPRLQPDAASLPAPRPVDGRPVGARVRTARWWAVGVLTAATVALAAYLALVLLATWLMVSAVDAVTDLGTRPLDVTSLLLDVAPGLLLGWCVGLILAGVLARGQALGARAAGCVAGTLGSFAGGAVLAATGIL
ncbi:hypothetical protein ACOCJ4_14250 [Knoellia sp. CPCC 206435]|uniref:hypothetical protein n=1 Tax=Knoellia terrae TaxID=3404797 RepID=UPI003B432CD0